MAAVGGCCGLPDWAAAADAAPPWSAWLMAVVGGCCPMADPAAPALGPEPASCASSVLVNCSISPVHCPAPADAMGTSKAQPATTNAMVFMRASMLLPL